MIAVKCVDSMLSALRRPVRVAGYFYLTESGDKTHALGMNLNERVGVNEGVFERFKTEILYDMQGAKTSISVIYTRLAVGGSTELSFFSE